MKKSFLIFASFLAMGLISVGAQADDSEVPTPIPTPSPPKMNLAQCIDKALVVAPSIQAAIADRQAMEARRSEAKSAYFLPDIRLRVLGGLVPDVPNGSGPEANFPEVDTKLSNLGPFIQARVEAIQPVYTFGRLSGLSKAAQVGEDAKRAQERLARDEVIRQVKKVYVGVVALMSVEDFLSELRDRAHSAKDKVEELIKKHSADVTDIDLMRLQVFFAETDRNLVEVRSGIQLGMATLGILTGGIQAGPIAPTESSLQFQETNLGPLETYLSLSRRTRPELRQVSDLVEAKKALMSASKGEFFPMIFLGGFYQYGKAPDREHVDNPFLNDNFNYNSGGASLGMEQKLSFHMTNSRYHQAKAEYQKALFDQKQASLGIELEVRKFYSVASAKADAVKAAREGFRAGRSWVTATTLNFGVGLVPVKDLLEAFVAYSRVKLGFLDTIEDYVVALADLSRAVGAEISDVGR